MALTTAVTESLSCKLCSFYVFDNSIYKECLEGYPAYANCLISSHYSGKNGQAVGYFIPQGEVFDKRKLRRLFKDGDSYDALFFEASIEGVPLFSMPGVK